MQQGKAPRRFGTRPTGRPWRGVAWRGETPLRRPAGRGAALRCPGGLLALRVQGGGVGAGPPPSPPASHA